MSKTDCIADDAIGGDAARAWVSAFDDDLIAHAAHLSELDAALGEGRFAEHMRFALGKSRSFLAEAGTDSFRGTFIALASGFLETSTMSGAMLGMFFHQLAKSAKGTEAVTALAIADATLSAGALLGRRGGSQLGDKTLLDALVPAGNALGDAVRSGSGAPAGLESAAAAARAGARATVTMSARQGRAARMGVVGIGTADPGAVTIALFYAAGARTLAERE